MAEIELGIKIEPGQAQAGAAQIEKALDAVGKAAADAQKAVSGVAPAVGTSTQQSVRASMNAIQALESKLRTTNQQIEAAVKSGLLSKEEAERAGRDAGAAFARGMSQQFKAGQLAGLDTGGVFKAGGQSFMAFEGQLRSVSNYSKSAGQGFGMMRESVASLASQMAGVHPMFGRLSNVLMGFAAGGAVTVGVLAGVAAIAFVYQKLTAETKKAREESEKFREELTKQRQEAMRGAVGMAEDKAKKAVEERTNAEKQYKAAVEAATLADAAGVSQRGTAAALWKKATELRAIYTETVENAAYADSEAGRLQREEARKSVDAARDTAKALVEAHEKEAAAAKKAAKATDDLVSASYRLYLARQKIAQTTPGAVSGGGTVTFAGANDPKYSLGASVAGAKANAEGKAAADVMEKIWEEAIRGIQQSFARGFEQIFTDGLSGFDDFADAVLDTFRGVAAQIAAAVTSKALGLDAALAALQKPKSEGGGIGAAWESLPPAGKVGTVAAVTLAVVDFTKSLFGTSDAAKEAAERLRQLRRQLNESFWDAFAAAQQEVYGAPDPFAQANIRRGGLTAQLDAAYAQGAMSAATYLDAVQRITDLYNEEMRRALEAVADATREAAEAEARLAAERQAAADALVSTIVRGREDWGVELLRAKGDITTADATQRQLDQNRALAETTDEVTRELIRQTFAAKEVAVGVAAMAAEEARLAEVRQQARDFAEDVAIRQAQLISDEEGARVRLQIQQQKEIENAQKLLIAGTISQELYDEFINLLGDEFTVAMTGAAAATQDAADAARELEDATRTREGLIVRSLRATGQDRAADEYGLLTGQRQERVDFVEKYGTKSPELVALLDIVQGQERNAFYVKRATDDAVAAIEGRLEQQLASLETQAEAARKQVELAQEQVSLQQQVVDATRQAYEAIKEYSKSLLLGDKTILSPTQQLVEAERQYNTVLAKAMAGDKAAALALPEIADRFLTASRDVNASTVAYAQDFSQVQAAFTSLESRYGVQLTIEQQMLAVMQSQLTAANAAVTAAQTAASAARADAAAQIATVKAEGAAQIAAGASAAADARALLQEQIDNLEAQVTATNVQTQTLDEIKNLTGTTDFGTLALVDVLTASYQLADVNGRSTITTLVEISNLTRDVISLNATGFLEVQNAVFAVRDAVVTGTSTLRTTIQEAQPV